MPRKPWVLIRRCASLVRHPRISQAINIPRLRSSMVISHLENRKPFYPVIGNLESHGSRYGDMRRGSGTRISPGLELLTFLDSDHKIISWFLLKQRFDFGVWENVIHLSHGVKITPWPEPLSDYSHILNEEQKWINKHEARTPNMMKDKINFTFIERN